MRCDPGYPALREKEKKPRRIWASAEALIRSKAGKVNLKLDLDVK